MKKSSNLLAALQLLGVFATSALIARPAHAAYHGSSDCEYKDKDVEVTMSQREGSEGLGFDGIKVRDRKSGKTLIYANTTDNFYGDLNAGETIKFKGDKEDATFEVVSVKVIRDNSTSDDCNIEDDLTTSVAMKMQLPFQPKQMTFTCHKEGGNPQMDISCRDRDVE